MFILNGNRFIEEFSLGIVYEVLLALGAIGFAYLIIIHYKKKNVHKSISKNKEKQNDS